MNVARYLVEGCDVWMNNPRRPLEASGTSGMKVIANGGLNFSVLDGWWDEGYDASLGWKIGNGEEYDDIDYQDEIESRLIYETLEKEIVPLFYDRTDDKLPRKWIRMMKNSMKTLGPVFNTHRMVQEYHVKFYDKAYKNRKLLLKSDFEKGKEFSIWKSNLQANWDKVRILSIDEKVKNGELTVGTKYKITAEVALGNLSPNDVEVQIYYGKVDEQNIPHSNEFVNMKNSSGENGKYIYTGEINCERTGQFGYTLRVLPNNSLLINQFELGLIKWA